MTGWRSSAWVPAGLAVALLGALVVVRTTDEGRGDAESGATPARELPAELGWEHVDLGDLRVTSVTPSWTDETPGVTVAGADGDRAAMLDYTLGRGQVAPQFYRYEEPADGIATVVGDGVVTVMTIADDGQMDDRLWLGSDGWWASTAAPKTASGAVPEYAVPVPQDEDGYLGAVGIVDGADGPVLGGWSDSGSWRRIDDVELPLPRSPASDNTASGVLAAATEGTLYGVVQDDAGADVVAIDAYGEGRRTRWRPVRLDAGLDRVTGTEEWDLGVWLTGHDDLRPRVFSLPGGVTGRSVQVPDTRLDPDHPKVELLAEPAWQPMALALQAAQGPEIWVRLRGKWSRFPAPPGRFEDGALVEDTLFLVVDGELFTGRLPERFLPRDALGSGE